MNYLEVAIGQPVSVRDDEARIWWDKLSDDEKKLALTLPRFDVNRRKFVVA